LTIAVGTLAVRDYLAGVHSQYHSSTDARGSWSTQGAKDRFGAVLFVEKEGFLPLFEKVGRAPGRGVGAPVLGSVRGVVRLP